MVLHLCIRSSRMRPLFEVYGKSRCFKIVDTGFDNRNNSAISVKFGEFLKSPEVFRLHVLTHRQMKLHHSLGDKKVT
jgi:hypothetical protein